MSFRQPGDFDIEALHAALEAQRVARGMSWAQVAREINVQFNAAVVRRISASTVTGMRGRIVVEGDGVLQMLRWLKRTRKALFPDFPDSCKRRVTRRGNPTDPEVRYPGNLCGAQREASGKTNDMEAGRSRDRRSERTDAHTAVAGWAHCLPARDENREVAWTVGRQSDTRVVLLISGSMRKGR